MRLAFYQPDIPQNLGAAIRLAACFGAGVDVIEPCGFPLTDRALRRAALDYGESVVVVRHVGWTEFARAASAASSRLILFTTTGEATLDAFGFRRDDILLFGRESAGAPADVHAACDARLRIPIASGARSLNIVTAAAIALWEARRQSGLAAAGSFADT